MVMRNDCLQMAGNGQVKLYVPFDGLLLAEATDEPGVFIKL